MKKNNFWPSYRFYSLWATFLILMMIDNDIIIFFCKSLMSLSQFLRFPFSFLWSWSKKTKNPPNSILWLIVVSLKVIGSIFALFDIFTAFLCNTSQIVTKIFAIAFDKFLKITLTFVWEKWTSPQLWSKSFYILSIFTYGMPILQRSSVHK